MVTLSSVWVSPASGTAGVGGAAVLAACAFFLKLFSKVSPGKELGLNNAERKEFKCKVYSKFKISSKFLYVFILFS